MDSIKFAPQLLSCSFHLHVYLLPMVYSLSRGINVLVLWPLVSVDCSSRLFLVGNYRFSTYSI